MSELSVTDLPVQSEFELEEFMNFSKETRLDSTTFNKLLTLWEEWASLLKIKQIKTGMESWLVVWLPEEVDKAVDEAWAQSPTQGYLMNALAQFMCMTAVQEVLPQAAEGGCAPTPRPHSDLRAALIDLAVAGEDGGLLRRYAVISYFPFRGGCEICAMKNECPKGIGGDGAEKYLSMVLPGHER